MVSGERRRVLSAEAVDVYDRLCGGEHLRRTLKSRRHRGNLGSYSGGGLRQQNDGSLSGTGDQGRKADLRPRTSSPFQRSSGCNGRELLA